MRTSTPARASLVMAIALALVAPAAFTACGSKSETPAPAPAPAVAAPATPASEPIAAISAPTTLNAAKVALGRRLFHDPTLSGDATLSCSTCHSLDMGGAEHKRTSDGIGGHVGPINSPTVLNSSLNFVQFWDGRAATLEEQAAGPIGNPGEMGNTVEEAVTALKAKPDYVRLFAAAYPEGITATTVTHAIAEYERSLITPSPFDKFLGGDESAISAQAKRGYETFKTVGCTACHNGPNVGGAIYQKMGLVRSYFDLRGTPLTEADNGRFNVTHDPADRHKFKVPTLRNIALTAPYFHDGSRETLEEAVKIMGQVQLGRELTVAQIADIVAFLGTLTGELPATARPTPDELVPSSVPAPAADGTGPANGPPSGPTISGAGTTRAPHSGIGGARSGLAPSVFEAAHDDVFGAGGLGTQGVGSGGS